MKYLLVVGEASADEHASRLITALKEKDPQAKFAFIGGDLMAKAANTSPVLHYREIAIMGFIAIITHWGRIKKAASTLQEVLDTFRPDIVIPVDYGGFNLRYTLPMAHKRGILVYYYIPPKVWAWRSSRVKTLKHYIQKSFVILPFEESYLRSRGLDAYFVGNPSVESVGAFYNTNKDHRSREQRIVIALLPGSRKGEIAKNLPIMLKAIDLLPFGKEILLAGAPGIDSSYYNPWISSRLDITLLHQQTHSILSRSHIAWVTSGTATLETALIGTPQVVCYRSSGLRLERYVFEKLFPISHFSLVNLVLQQSLVPELLSDRVTPEALRDVSLQILSDSSKIEEGYDRLRNLLGVHPVASRVADLIFHS